jgi:hypothetical protein
MISIDEKELVEFLKRVNNHKWNHRDNKNTVSIVMKQWVKELEHIVDNGIFEGCEREDIEWYVKKGGKLPEEEDE